MLVDDKLVLRVRRIVCLGAGIALFMVVWGGPVSAAFDGANGLIAFECDGVDLCTVRPDGTGWSTLVASEGEGGLESPAWSPDGSRVLYVRGDEAAPGFTDIWVVDADGSNATNLTDSPAISEWDPSWSPDGTKVVYSRGTGFDGDLWTMDADGTGQAQLTDRLGVEEGAVYSSDGALIAFVGSTEPEPARIYVGDSDGSDIDAVTGSKRAAWYPDWHPVKQNLVYYARYDEDFELVAVRWDGSRRTRLTRNRVHDVLPAWSPNGRWIVFNQTRDGKKDLFRLRPNGSRLRRITWDGDTEVPDWQPLP